MRKTARFIWATAVLLPGLGPDDNPRRNGTLDYYMSEPIRDNDFKGVGPFLIMATEYEE